MDIFYKYTKNFGADYFLRPTVKISNPKFLNDPFESEIGDNLVQYVASILKITDTDEIDGLKKTFNDVLKANGVFSVSETSRNSLMWSHYGDEHRGLCIGLNKELFNDAVKPTQSIHRLAEYIPKKVSYDNYRFDRNYISKSGYNLTDYLKEHFLTKSDYWIYEKEYRCIVPFSCSTSFIVNKDSEYQYSNVDPSVSIDDLISNWKEKEKIKINERSEYVLRGDDKYQATSILSTFGCVSFLYNIDPKHIYSIHAGVRFKDQDLKDLYLMITENPTLSHIKIYRFKLSDKRFEILPEVVDAEYIARLTS
ncbi:DUF2971 domain-containing protein [Aeromonas veronii]|uniref:DUF2971 domain-containing protein n=1 Tax=Aeromonas veronii TaxID=654 RepID=UPI001F488E6E|nr:DUF2971 domain-containing protein [Aeromonas veronii]MCF5874827.1 DUF2971 domain-containing protein [Aeromonas veronii]